jgi:hypothetical protein
LKYDISRLIRTSVMTADKDAKGCYDQIIRILATLAMDLGRFLKSPVPGSNCRSRYSCLRGEDIYFISWLWIQIL